MAAKVEIYTWATCPFCMRAKSLLKTKNVDFIEYSIDGKPFKKKDLFTQWSRVIHLPWYIVLEEELKNKQHTIRIRMSADKNEKSKGNACRILYFLVNG